MHSQQPLTREGKNISSTSFAVSTSIADLVVSVYEIEIQGDSYWDTVPTPKREARKMSRNPSDTQKAKTLALCHAISPPSERWNKLLVICYMERADQSHYIQKNRVDHTPLDPERGKGYIPPSFHHHFGKRWRIIHDRPHDTCAQNIMHATSLHHKGCSNIFSILSNLNLDSICLVRGGDFFPYGFLPSSLCWVVTLIVVMGDIWY